MKNLRNPFYVCILTIFALTSCLEDADDNGNRLPRPSIYDRLEASTEHTLLKAAIDSTGLDLTFKNSGSFTLFAPTDAAFTQFLASNSITDINTIPRADLRNLILYHVLQVVNRDTDFVAGYTKTSALSPDEKTLDLYVQIAPDLLLNNAVTINRSNVTASNGVLHFTDQVLELPTLASLVAANPDYSNLNTALTQQNLVTALENVAVTGVNAAPFTVFAPTDAAFLALINESTTDALDNITDVLALTNLTDILLYHVVSGTATRGDDFRDNTVVDPITTGTFVINTASGIVITDGSGRLVNIVERDITAINGVLHTLDNVLQF